MILIKITFILFPFAKSSIFEIMCNLNNIITLITSVNSAIFTVVNKTTSTPFGVKLFHTIHVN